MADHTLVRRRLRWAVPAVLVLAVVAFFAVRAGTALGRPARQAHQGAAGTVGDPPDPWPFEEEVTQVKIKNTFGTPEAPVPWPATCPDGHTMSPKDHHFGPTNSSSRATASRRATDSVSGRAIRQAMPN